MVKDFSTMGSCGSRNIFFSKVNTNYKEFFRINDSIEGVNLISLMSKPIEYYYKEINSPHAYDNTCVKSDLSKKFLNFLKEDKIDYLVLDTYFDAKYGVILVDDDSFASESYRLKKTDFYKKIENRPVIYVHEDFDEFMKL